MGAHLLIVGGVIRNRPEKWRAEYTLSMVLLRDLVDADLGQERVELSESEMTRYALMIAGDSATGLDVLFEGGQPTCPSYAFVLAGWGLERMGQVAPVDHTRTMLAGVTLDLHRPLPDEGAVNMHGRISHVWDTGRAALIEVEVRCDFFTLRFVTYAPEAGGFGGDPPPPPLSRAELPMELAVLLPTTESVLYRKIDPAGDAGVASARPVQPGLVMMARAFVAMLLQLQASPDRVRRVEGRFISPARSGEPLTLIARTDGNFLVRGDRGVVIDGGLMVLATLPALP